ncbi:Unknown protein [Striga hermonthica]|uniref:CCHC-type domain-containing protein n=1 Tax=Striga hermonthica TaxID=68872 RepID=A0A9N7NRR4_STRHE|nr:Unknown protein [Striga hermonthica]
MADEISDKLLKFRLSEKEGDGLELSEEDIAPGLRECQLSLVGICYGEKKINVNGLKTTLGNIWFTRQPFSIRVLGFNKYQFLFQNEEDRDKILRGKAWSFDGQYLVLKIWDPKHLEFTDEEEVVKVWVHIQNLPLHWTTEESGLKIGKKLGNVVNVQAPGTGNGAGQNLRVLVELKLKEPIMRGTFIKVGQENTWIDFRYENLQTFCYYCGRIGHGDKNCLVKKDDIKNNVPKLGQFGDWLRVGTSPFGDGRIFASNSSGSYQGRVSQSPNHARSLGITVSEDKSDNGLKESIGATNDAMFTADMNPTPNSKPEDPVGTAIPSVPLQTMEVSDNDSPCNPSPLFEVEVHTSTRIPSGGNRKRPPFSRKPRIKAELDRQLMVIDENSPTAFGGESSKNGKKRSLELDCTTPEMECAAVGVKEKLSKENQSNESQSQATRVEDLQAGVGQAQIAVSALSNTLGWLGCGGGIISDGVLVQKWSEAEAFTGTIEEGKLRAVRRALEKAEEYNMEVIICYVDDKNLASKLQNQYSFTCQFDIIAVDIYHLISKFRVCNFIYDCSRCSDCVSLAKMAVEGKLNVASQDEDALIV